MAVVVTLRLALGEPEEEAQPEAEPQGLEEGGSVGVPDTLVEPVSVLDTEADPVSGTVGVMERVPDSEELSDDVTEGEPEGEMEGEPVKEAETEEDLDRDRDTVAQPVACPDWLGEAVTVAESVGLALALPEDEEAEEAERAPVPLAAPVPVGTTVPDRLGVAEPE